MQDSVLSLLQEVSYSVIMKWRRTNEKTKGRKREHRTAYEVWIVECDLVEVGVGRRCHFLAEAKQSSFDRWFPGVKKFRLQIYMQYYLVLFCFLFFCCGGGKLRDVCSKTEYDHVQYIVKDHISYFNFSYTHIYKVIDFYTQKSETKQEYLYLRYFPFSSLSTFSTLFFIHNYPRNFFTSIMPVAAATIPPILLVATYVNAFFVSPCSNQLTTSTLYVEKVVYEPQNPTPSINFVRGDNDTLGK